MYAYVKVIFALAQLHWAITHTRTMAQEIPEKLQSASKLPVSQAHIWTNKKAVTPEIQHAKCGPNDVTSSIK